MKTRVLDRRFLRKMDYSLLFGILAIVLVGLIMIYSATHAKISDPKYFVKRQFTFFIIGLVLMYIIINSDYKFLRRFNRHIYFGNLILLALVLVAGSTAKGAQRWIGFGPFVLQPSEFAKLSIIITLSHLLASRERKIETLWDFIPAFIHVAIPMLLILIQPDLGTSLVFMAILFGILYVYGANPKILTAMILTGVIVASGSLYLHFKYGLWLPLKDYQITRLIIFINPEIDKSGAGYHITQAKIAIGSGQIFGKGLFEGTQSQLKFLPENHTDFIFSVIGEEFGFIGATAVLMLYMFVVWRCIRISSEARDLYGTLLTAGVASMFTFHAVINIGMNVGIMPVTGIPLPLISYGGSSLLMNMISFGFVLNVYMRRQKLMFS